MYQENCKIHGKEAGVTINSQEMKVRLWQVITDVPVVGIQQDGTRLCSYIEV